jgi:PAS domain S-box-containing protein
VQQPLPAAPAFGDATLSNCEREQIHLAGCIQPHGALISVHEIDQTILQASANARAFLGLDTPLPGLRLRALGPDLYRRAREMPAEPDFIPYVARCRLADPRRMVNALMHRTAGGELVIEFENAASLADPLADVERALETIIAAGSLSSLCDATAHVFKEITGYDRVMIYRFDEEGHGEVFAETRKPELEAFLGNRYPASDIPQIARRLYVRNRVRILADVQYAPAPLVPSASPLTGEALDMSLCFLRSASPIHVQYLKNMGVSATLVVSIMVGEKLWGLISCHHYSPRFLPFEMRSFCELIGEAVGMRIAALESFVRGQCELAARRLEQKMVESLSRDGDWRGALFDGARSALLPLGASGAALVFEGRIQSIGEAPSSEQIRALANWLASRFVDGFYATASLAAEAPQFAALAGSAAGVAAARVSGDASELLIWFRRERVRTITWGGKPFKSPSDDDDPSELSPRRSFAQWHQIVEGTSDPWSGADIATARMIGASVADVIVQFRAVQIVIAKDQLDQVSSRLKASEQLVILADSSGRLLESNAAFETLVGARNGSVARLEDLPAFFAEPETLARQLESLKQSRRGFGNDLSLRAHDGRIVPLRVRADAITAPGERALGYVLTFADLTARREAENARRRFQETLVGSRRRISARLDTSAELQAQGLIAQVIENAQLAALEVTDSADPANMRKLLDGIRSAVERSAEVLERLRLQPPAPDRKQ